MFEGLYYYWYYTQHTGHIIVNQVSSLGPDRMIIISRHEVDGEIIVYDNDVFF